MENEAFEVARLSVAAPVDGMLRVLARQQGDRVHYRLVESGSGHSVAGHVRAEADLARPMTLAELAAFVLDGALFDQPSFEDLLGEHFADDRNAAMRAIVAGSTSYPEFDPLCRQRIRDHFADDSAGDECPFCGDFNSPPADALCAHAAGWYWDGLLEPLGKGVTLAGAIDDVRELGGRGSADARILTVLAGKGSLRGRLVGKARKGLEAVLLGLADAQAGEGWTTDGMLGGGGSTLYVPDAARLDFLAGECAALVAACRMALHTDDSAGDAGGADPA